MRIDELMTESGVAFGTSGARGLVAKMTDRVCYAYTLAFIQYLQGSGKLAEATQLGIAGDLRPSSERIMAACALAATASGLRVRFFGRVPSPALAAIGTAEGIPTMMVTGSHIPDDRNGIKFNTPTGEILKDDEAGIRAQAVTLPAGLFDREGYFAKEWAARLPVFDREGLTRYVARYLSFYPQGCLSGVRVGVYEHSSVANEAYHEVLTGLGAEVTLLGRSETFVPVDTEAIRPEDIAVASQWAATGAFDALVSADGDGDRPLVSDEHGNWLRGDVAGVLCARHLGAAAVATPISSNTAVDLCGSFQRVLRTRIGSPYVIAGMAELSSAGYAPVVGYEANGGFLTASDIVRDGRRLPALPTRDALIVALSILLSGPARGRPISALVGELPRRFTYSDRLREFPTEISRRRLAELSTGHAQRDWRAVEALFGAAFGPVSTLDTTDGLRITFASGAIAHLRPSGNAPELRAYTEAETPGRAAEMNRRCLAILAAWREGSEAARG